MIISYVTDYEPAAIISTPKYDSVSFTHLDGSERGGRRAIQYIDPKRCGKLPTQSLTSVVSKHRCSGLASRLAEGQNLYHEL